MKIWMIINEVPSGPMSVDEAIAAGLTEDTTVWIPGLDDWKRAGDVVELRRYVGRAAVPPAIPQVPASSAPGSEGDVPPMPPTYLIWSILATVLCCLVPGIIAILYSNRVSTAYFNGDYDKARRCSEMAEWWIMISIVAGLVWTPFSFIVFAV